MPTQDATQPISRVADFLGSLGLWVMGLGFLGCVGLLGFQIYMWLYSGEWVPIPLAFVPAALGVNLNPIYEPQSWRGLAVLGELVLDLPLSLSLLLIGFAIGAFVVSIAEDLRP